MVDRARYLLRDPTGYAAALHMRPTERSVRPYAEGACWASGFWDREVVNIARKAANMRGPVFARLAVITLIGLSHSTGANAQSPEAIVATFYPSLRLAPENETDRHSCSAVLSATRDGQPTVIAAGYTDGTASVLRILRRNGPGSFTVAAESDASLDLVGRDCLIGPVELTGDDRSNLMLELYGVEGAEAWVFTWDGSVLTSLTPTEILDGKRRSLFLTTYLCDLDHDGVLEIIAARKHLGDPASDAGAVYRLGVGGSGYVLEKYILNFSMFFVGDDPSMTATFSLVPDSVGPYTLKVVNGEETGQDRVSGGSILLNGVEVVSPSQLTVQSEFVTFFIESLPVDNELSVTLSGVKDFSFIHVTIEDSTVR